MPRLDDDDDYRDLRRRREPVEREETSLKDLVDLVGRRLSGAILGAGAMIALGVYAGGGTEVEAPRYQVYAQDGELFRVNTESGTVIACNADRCMTVLEKGQRLAEDKGNTLFRSPAGSTPAALPASGPAATPVPADAQPAPAPKQ